MQIRQQALRAYWPNIYTVYDILVSIWGRVTTFKLRFWMTFVGHFREWVKRTRLFYEMHQFLASLHLGKIMSFFFYCSNLRICFVFCYTICSEFIKLSASVFVQGFCNTDWHVPWFSYSIIQMAFPSLI